MELEGSDWHSKRLPLVCGHCYITDCAQQQVLGDIKQRGEGKQGQYESGVCVWRQMMQEGDCHCHAFPDEATSWKFGGPAYSIYCRNPHLVPTELTPHISGNCPLSVHSFFLSFSLLQDNTTKAINQILAELEYKAHRETTGWIRNHLMPRLDIVQGDGIIKDPPPLHRHKSRHNQMFPHSG